MPKPSTLATVTRLVSAAFASRPETHDSRKAVDDVCLHLTHAHVHSFLIVGRLRLRDFPLLRPKKSKSEILDDIWDGVAAHTRDARVPDWYGADATILQLAEYVEKGSNG